MTVGVRLRRAGVLLVLAAVAPGAAQYLLGDRRLGRWALRIWAGVWAVGLGLGLLWFLWRGPVLRLLTWPPVLLLAGVLGHLIALGVAVLMLDAWRLSRPAELPRRMRPVLALFLVLALLGGTAPWLAAGRRSWTAGQLIDTMFGSGRHSAPVGGRVNVLLLGGDSGRGRIGTRPDSITLASIDVASGRTALVSLPRNLENAPFPAGTPASVAWPHGFSCGDTCLLNAVYTWGSEHPALFPGAHDPGAEAMKQAVAGVTGLTVNYYVLIDLAGFEALVNALGGITVRVGSAVPIGGETSRVSGYLRPGVQRLDGYHALWFARSRHGASDYARMARQRCVMNAMLHQLDPATVLERFQQIAAAGARTVGTDLPADALADLLELAAKARRQPVTTIQFVPPLIVPARPDLAAIRARVRAALASAATPAPTPVPTPSASPRPTGNGASAAPRTPGAGAGGSAASAQDLASVCAAG